MSIHYLAPIGRIRVIFLSIAIGILLFALGFNMTSIFDMMPKISLELQLTPAELRWLVNTYMLTATVFIMAGGKLGDYVRKKWILAAAAVVFVAASLLVGCSVNLWMILLGRLIQGIGLAFVLPATITLLKVTVPNEKQMIAFGIWSAMLGLGFASGPTLGGMITLWLSWRYVFVITAVIMFIGLVCAWFLLPRYKENLKPFHLDWLGIILFVAGFGLLIVGLMQGSVWGWLALKTLAFIVIGVIFCVLFFVAEAFIRGPLVMLEDFSDRGLMAPVVGAFAYGFAMITTLACILKYLQLPLLIHMDALTAGIALLPFSVAVFIFSVGMDLLYKLCANFRIYLGVGFALIAIGFLILCFVNIQTTYAFFVLPLILLGIGIAFIQSNLPKAAADAVVPEKVGEATGLIWTVFYLGGVIAVIAIGLTFHSVWSHIFLSGMIDHTLSRQLGEDIISKLNSGEYSLLYILQHLQTNASTAVAPAFQVASVLAMKSVMATSAAVVAIVGLISLLLSKRG